MIISNDGIRKPIYGSIIITLKSQQIRNNILTAYRNMPNRNFFFDNDQKVKLFVNEYLSPSRQRILYEAKLFAKTNGFKFIWVKNGDILMKKNENSKCYSHQLTHGLCQH